jgi:hypothetical protein
MKTYAASTIADPAATSSAAPGYELMGILRAVLILALIATYPIVEKEWLSDYLAPDVLAAHRALARAGHDGGDLAVDAVLRGERPAPTSSSMTSRLRLRKSLHYGHEACRSLRARRSRR